MEWYLNDGLNNRLQWGSEIWTCLDFELSKRGWVEEGPNFKWNLKSRGPTIRSNGHHFDKKKHLKSGQKHPNFDISSMCDIYLTSYRTRQAWDMFQGLCKKRKEGRKIETSNDTIAGHSRWLLISVFLLWSLFFYCLIMKMYLLTSSLIRFINLRHLR